MRIAIVDFEFPERDRSSGGHRLFELTRIMASRHSVHFLSVDYWRKWETQDGRHRKALEGMGVVCEHDPTGCVGERSGRFFDGACPDVAILCRYYVCNLFSFYVRTMFPNCRIVLDTVDAHCVRERRMKAMTGRGNPEMVERLESAAAASADRVWTVTENDAAVMSGWNRNVDVIPNIHPVVQDRGLPFERRAGAVFVGNYVHQPNFDALWWWSNSIWTFMPVGEKLVAVGPNLPSGAMSGVEAAGWVPDLTGFLGGKKVGVAPLRYGSGMKGKIGDYLACGLPCVTTSVGAVGMGLRDGVDCLVRDDPKAFAEAVSGLGRDKGRWEAMSEAGRRWAAGFSPEVVGPKVLAALDRV
jgi:glycosyltransferase involved in cell wall biosynthesis